MANKRQYCAIIGDINKSRGLPARGRVQKKFQKSIDSINREFRPQIASRFKLTLGDEFQGLLKSPAQSYRLVRRFQDLMGIVPFAFGIGIGPLATPVIPKEALGMDGECFYRAREALKLAKKKKQEVVYDFPGPALRLVNVLISSLEKQWKSLNPTDQRIVQLSKEDLTQKDMAKELGITQQAISKVYRSKVIREMVDADGAIYEFFSTYSVSRTTTK